MNKQPDFGNDLAALNENVTAAVDDVLQVLQQKRTVGNSGMPKRPEVGTKKQTTDLPIPLKAETEQPVATNVSRRQGSVGHLRLSRTFERVEPLENVTTRLRRKTIELLTEANLRQQLKKESPATRQDIIEAALGDWFRKHGYGGRLGKESSDT